MKRPESSQNEPDISLYSAARRAFQKQANTDATLPERICQELWAITPRHERKKMEIAFAHDHPGGSLSTKSIYYRRLLLERHVMITMLEALWRAGSYDETTLPNDHEISSDDNDPS